MKNKKLEREETAMIEIGNTDISKKNQKLLLALFLILITSSAFIQLLFNINEEVATKVFINNDHTIEASSGIIERAINLNNRLLNDIGNYETTIENNSIFRKKLLPITQAGLLQLFTVGNENAWLSKDKFYYKFSNQYVTQPGFLDENQLKKRTKEKVQPNPVIAILDFKEKLAKKNIQLIVVPAPPKASFLYRKDGETLNNESYVTFVRQLERNGIVVCDVFKLLENQSLENSGFLKYDTHWSPEVVKIVSNKICNLLDSLAIPKGNSKYITKKFTVNNYGDIVDMLNINNKKAHFKQQFVEVEQILEENYLFNPSKRSDILFLGDSYSNIYSLKEMNWGNSAGLSEHISANMQKPIDRIIMNDAGAYATRLSLSNELKRGRNRLDGKKIVIWEFAARELSVGDWRLLEMKLNQNYVSNYFIPKQNTSFTVTGIVNGMSKVPMPITVPYKDHLVALHITDLKDMNTKKDLGESVVYISSMENNNWTAAAQLRNGQEIKLKLYNWNDYINIYGSINRSELEDEQLSFVDPCWGVLIKQ